MSVENEIYATTLPLPQVDAFTEPVLHAGPVGEMSLLRVRAADLALVTNISIEDAVPVTEAVRILENFEAFAGHATIDLPNIEGLTKTERTAVIASALVHDMRDQVRTEATDILIEQKEAAVNEVEELREIIETDTSDAVKQNRLLQIENDRLSLLLAKEQKKSTGLQQRLHDQALIAANRKLEGPRRFMRTTRARGAIALKATQLTFKSK